MKYHSITTRKVVILQPIATTGTNDNAISDLIRILTHTVEINWKTKTLLGANLKITKFYVIKNLSIHHSSKSEIPEYHTSWQGEEFLIINTDSKTCRRLERLL